MDTVQIPLSGKNSDKTFTISKIDYERVSQHDWYLWGDYPNNAEIGKLHVFIMGARPYDVPHDHVRDHADRNTMNAARLNLRYVPRSFNNWNRAVTPEASSRFKGVHYHSLKEKWAAFFLGYYLGDFAEERDAALMVATAAILEWQDLAVTSDLLVADDLLTAQEIAEIQQKIASEDFKLKKSRFDRDLPPGVYKYHNTGRFLVKVADKRVGVYDTVPEAKDAFEDATRAYKTAEQIRQMQEWNEYQKVPIPRDSDGNAMIKLTGNKGEGLHTIVPDKWWHQVTYKVSWNLVSGYAHGCWQGRPTKLHHVIFKLCNPDVKVQGSIDHIDPYQRLNNLETNLRDATDEIQAYNKAKKANCTSQYAGVCFEKSSGKWRGRINHEKKRYSTRPHVSEHEAARELNKLAKELKGEFARVLVINDPASTQDTA